MPHIKDETVGYLQAAFHLTPISRFNMEKWGSIYLKYFFLFRLFEMFRIILFCKIFYVRLLFLAEMDKVKFMEYSL